MPGLPEVETVAPCSPHDPSGCFAVGVRPVDIPHHGQLVRAGEIPWVDQTARILLTFSINRQIMRISPEVRTSRYALEML